HSRRLARLCPGEEPCGHRPGRGPEPQLPWRYQHCRHGAEALDHITYQVPACNDLGSRPAPPTKEHRFPAVALYDFLLRNEAYLRRFPTLRPERRVHQSPVDAEVLLLVLEAPSSARARAAKATSALPPPRQYLRSAAQELRARQAASLQLLCT